DPVPFGEQRDEPVRVGEHVPERDRVGRLTERLTHRRSGAFTSPNTTTSWTFKLKIPLNRTRNAGVGLPCPDSGYTATRRRSRSPPDTTSEIAGAVGIVPP